MLRRKAILFLVVLLGLFWVNNRSIGVVKANECTPGVCYYTDDINKTGLMRCSESANGYVSINEGDQPCDRFVSNTNETKWVEPTNRTLVSGNNSYDPFAGCTSTSINTSLGCIPVEMSEFIPWLMSWLFGVAGGIAFLLMVYGFILIATSSGDEKKVAGAKETITSAVIGLLVCIFSVFILRLIAVNILNIPGF